MIEPSSRPVASRIDVSTSASLSQSTVIRGLRSLLAKTLLGLALFGMLGIGGTVLGAEIFAEPRIISTDKPSLTPADNQSKDGANAQPDKNTNNQANVRIKGAGFVEPAGEVRRLMLRTGGVIKECKVRSGDSVRKGDLLLSLEDSTLRAEVAVAESQLELAKKEAEYINVGVNPYRIKVVEQAIERVGEKFRHFRAEAERSRHLIASRATSRQEHDMIETQYRQAEAELHEQEAELNHLKHLVTPEQQAQMTAKVEHAKAQLELARARLAETELRAPFDGMILKVLKREGEGVNMYEPEPVVLFGDVSLLRVRAEVNERDVTRLQLGATASVFGRNLGDKTYTGRVVEIERMMGDKTVFTGSSADREELDELEVVIEMDPDFQAPVGLRVDVSIDAE